MSQGPFRVEAVEHSKQRLHGEVILTPQLSHTLILGFLLTWVVVLLVWLLASHYTRKENVTGWLEPPEGVIRVYSELTGTISTVYVREGSTVEKDDPLLAIDANTSLSVGQQLSSELLKEYEVQVHQLRQQIDIEETLLKGHLDEISKRIISEEKQYKSIQDQLSTSSELSEINNRQLLRLKSLDHSGYLSGVELESSLQRLLITKNEHEELVRDYLQRKNSIDQLRIEQQRMVDESKKTVSELEVRISDLNQKTTQIKGQNRLVIRAYRSGVVNNLQVRQGQQVNDTSTIPLLTILPSDAQLKATLVVPVRSAGFVEVGQTINVRYDAFPYQKFGIYSAKVAAISKTILLPNELLNSPVAPQEPVYILTADLVESSVRAYGKSLPLRPGMTLSADIKLENRSLIQWLFDPIYSISGRL